MESKTKATVKAVTNSMGIAKFSLVYGAKWNLFINGLDMQKEILISEGGN